MEVTFVIPCFNNVRFLGEAISSIREQRADATVAEIIVVDDYSDNEETRDTLSDLTRAGEVTVRRSTRGKGPGGARNSGIDAARTEWLAFLDNDDVLLPESLQARMAALDEFPDAEYVGADMQLWWPSRNELEEPFFKTRPRPRKILGEAFSRNQPIRLRRPVSLFAGTALTHSGTVLVKRCLLEKVNGYIETIRYCEDHHLWIKLSRLADFIFVPRSVMLYRQHEDNMTNFDAAAAPAPGEYLLPALGTLVDDPDFAPYRADINATRASLHFRNSAWYRYRRQYLSALREFGWGLGTRLAARKF